MLSIDSLRVTYGGAVEAVRGVTMEVPDGKVVAVLGSNGAGKSTLLRTISGTLKLHRGRVDEGSVRFEDEVLTGRDPGQIVRRGIVQVPEGRRIFGRLTVEETTCLQLGSPQLRPPHPPRGVPPGVAGPPGVTIQSQSSCGS